MSLPSEIINAPTIDRILKYGGMKLFNVFPLKSCTYREYRTCGNSKQDSDFLITQSVFVKIADFPNVFFSQFRTSVPFSSCFVAPSFIKHINHVIHSTRNKQMLRIKTWWIIAVMTNEKIAMYIKSIENSLADSVDRICASINYLESVSFWIFPFYPFPTTIFSNISIFHYIFFYRINVVPLQKYSSRKMVPMLSKPIVMNLAESFGSMSRPASLDFTSPLLYLISIHHNTMNRIAHVLKGARVFPFSEYGS